MQRDLECPRNLEEIERVLRIPSADDLVGEAFPRLVDDSAMPCGLDERDTTRGVTHVDEVSASTYPTLRLVPM